MVADAVPAPIPGPPPPSGVPMRGVRATITTGVIERAAGILVAVASVGFGVMTAPGALAQLPQLDPFWGPFVALVVGVSIALLGASVGIGRLARPAQALVALVILVALVTWPLTVHGALHPVDAVPWVWALCNVGTICAALVFSQWRAVLYTVVAPGAYIVVRCLPEGGGVPVGRAVLDGVYIMLVGGGGLILIVVVRRAAAAVDAAQATAVQRYTRAIREHATELERVQVDALVHDSVLTTLLSAARADTDDAEALAATMAANALRHLETAAVGLGTDVPPVTIHELHRRITASIAELAVPIPVRVMGSEAVTVPATVADALSTASLQAAVNSIQHAGAGVRRWVLLNGRAEGGVCIEIGDDGSGFDVAAVPAERLGVRRSIVERVQSVGAEAVLDTAPGDGTRVQLSWPGRTVGSRSVLRGGPHPFDAQRPPRDAAPVPTAPSDRSPTS